MIYARVLSEKKEQTKNLIPMIYFRTIEKNGKKMNVQ